MKIKKGILITLLSICLFGLKSQRANNWFFGSSAGLSFNSNTVLPILGGQLNGPDNASSISDQNGNLLFYTDGISVWNSQHLVMSNGSGLVGHYTAGQCALIVPIPCNNSKYVIFHTTEFSNPGYLHYTVVDMSLNNGLGDVVVSQKNISLGSGWTEKLCAYYNSSRHNYWVLAHKWNSDQFVAFDVNSTSIATSSIVSSIGSVHNCGTYTGAHDAMGQLTISPDGTKVLNALTCQDKFELFSFNSTTGVLSNSVSIAGAGGKAWGNAFSANSSKIYVNSIFGQSIFQYDISTYNQSSIIASEYTVVTVNTGGYNFGYMELGPNSKLYIARPGSFSISVINSPNANGSSCNFSIAGQSLGNKASTHGLSRIAYNIPNIAGNATSINSSLANSTLCLGSTATLAVVGVGPYLWSTGSTNSLITVTPTVTTTYSVLGNNTGEGTITEGCSNSASVTVNVLICNGLESFSNTPQLKLYPNPVKDKLSIDVLDNMPQTTLRILNSLGKEVLAIDLNAAVLNESNGSIEIKVSELPSGLYFIQLQDPIKTSFGKFIKEK
jgi:hypothetical protein